MFPELEEEVRPERALRAACVNCAALAVDRYLEARIEHEHSTIAYGGKETLVESYPISIAWPDDATLAHWPSIAECRARVIERLQLPASACIAVGVDRYDYTKGILERLNAVERLLDKYPQWIGRFVFVQVAAPTRSALDEYRNFQQRVQATADRINQTHGRPGYLPVHLLARHHDSDAVNELFRAADICVVTSLHDGMNLVCLERAIIFSTRQAPGNIHQNIFRVTDRT